MGDWDVVSTKPADSGGWDVVSTAPATDKPGILSRIGTDLSNRVSNMGKAFEGKSILRGIAEAPGEGVIALGQAAGFAGDVAGEGMKSTYNAVVPEGAQKAISGVMGKVANSAPVKAIAGTYGEFKESNPQAALALESGANIAGIVPGVSAAEDVGKMAVKAGATEAVSKVADKTAGRLINSLIKPHMREFSYGKNPGLGIAKEGIVATSLEDLGNKVAKVKNDVGQQISGIVSQPEYAGKSMNVADAIKPIDEAIAKAVKNSPRTNAALIERLTKAKMDILHVTEGENGELIYGRDLSTMTPQQTLDMKREIADITKFTGNMSDDAEANKSLKRVYGNLDNHLDEAVPPIKKLNERYADLTGADVAIKNRDKLLQRQNVVHLMSGLTGIATGIATGRPIEGIAGAVLYEALSSTMSKTVAAKIVEKLGYQLSAKSMKDFIPKNTMRKALTSGSYVAGKTALSSDNGE